MNTTTKTGNSDIFRFAILRLLLKIFSWTVVSLLQQVFVFKFRMNCCVLDNNPAYDLESEHCGHSQFTFIQLGQPQQKMFQANLLP